MSELTKISGALGSNPGGIYSDKSGQNHYIKFPNDPEQAKVEVATAKIYEKLGIKTTNPELEHSFPGKVGVRTKWDSDSSRMGGTEIDHKISTDPKFKHSVLKLYHAAALTNNFDAIGLDKDNILHHPSHGLVSVDQGGSMHFRAQGGSKDFSEDARPELVSLLHPRRPAGQVFGHAFKNSNASEIQAAKDSLKTLIDSHIDNIIKASGLDPKHAETIKSRRNSILES